MSNFQQTEWSDASKAAYFTDYASRYIPDRGRTHELLASLLSGVLVPRFPGRALAVLELGSGDGALSGVLMRRHSNITLTLLDGSQEMLDGARKRFGLGSQVHYIQATLQDVIAGRVDLGTQHFVVSSLAVHHLTLAEKTDLFTCAAHALVPGGAFANIDVVLSPTECLEHWYLELWRDWIRQHDLDTADGKAFAHIPTQYKQNEDNFPDTLQDQLVGLSRSGFEAVDVFFKNGVFAVYGGFKPRLAE
jgi:tRNA (cmo5U34)-methyltransferase